MEIILFAGWGIQVDCISFKKFEFSRRSGRSGPEPYPPFPRPQIPTRGSSHHPCNTILIAFVLFYYNENQVYNTVPDNLCKWHFLYTHKKKKIIKKKTLDLLRITDLISNLVRKCSRCFLGRNSFILGFFCLGKKRWGLDKEPPPIKKTIDPRLHFV